MLAMLPLKRYFQFSGRSGRPEYWQYVGLVVVATLVALVFDAAASPYSTVPRLATAVMLATTIPTYAVTVRRLHDRNISGWLVAAIWALNGIWFALDRVHASLGTSVINVPLLIAAGATVLAALALGIYLLVQMCRPGDAGTNRFGPPPTDLSAATPAGYSPAAMIADVAKTFRPGVPPVDPLDQIERMSKLHREGILTDAEFQQQKDMLLQHLKP